MKTVIKHEAVAYYDTGWNQGSDYKHYCELKKGWVFEHGRAEGCSSLFFNTLAEFRYATPVKAASFKNNMPKLKRLAKKMNCEVTESEGYTIEICANDGWSWENGERCSMIKGYGTGGYYSPKWRQETILDLLQELTDCPPENTPFLYD